MAELTQRWLKEIRMEEMTILPWCTVEMEGLGVHWWHLFTWRLVDIDFMITRFGNTDQQTVSYRMNFVMIEMTLPQKEDAFCFHGSSISKKILGTWNSVHNSVSLSLFLLIFPCDAPEVLFRIFSLMKYFLVAYTRLNKLLCRSVGWLLGAYDLWRSALFRLRLSLLPNVTFSLFRAQNYSF